MLAERIARAEKETQALQALINEKRRAESEQTVAEFSARVQQAGSDKLLAAESAENLKLSDYLLRATERLNRLNQQNLQTRQQLDTLNQTDQALEEQISVLEGSLLLSRILYQQKQALPSLQLDKNLADEIADIRLYQFELNQRREAAGNASAYVEQLLARQNEEDVTPELRRTLLDLATTRSELLDRLNRELDALLNASITLQLNQKQLQDTARALSDTLDEQMFWIPSNKPLDLSWLQGAPSASAQLASMPWLSALQELGAGLGAAAVLPAAAAADRRPALVAQQDRRQAQLAERADRPLPQRQPAAYTAGAIAQPLAGLAWRIVPRPLRLSAADGCTRTELRARCRPVRNGPGLAGVLQRLPHARRGVSPSCTSAGHGRRWPSCATRSAASA